MADEGAGLRVRESWKLEKIRDGVVVETIELGENEAVVRLDGEEA